MIFGFYLQGYRSNDRKYRSVKQYIQSLTFTPLRESGLSENLIKSLIGRAVYESREMLFYAEHFG